MPSFVSFKSKGKFRPCRSWTQTSVKAYIPTSGSGISFGLFPEGVKPDGLVVRSMPSRPLKKAIGVAPNTLRVYLVARIKGDVKQHRVDRINAQNQAAILDIAPLCEAQIVDGVVRCRVSVDDALRIRKRLKSASVNWN